MRTAVPDLEHATALAALEDLRRRIRRVSREVGEATARTRAGTELPWTGPAATAWRADVATLVSELEEGGSSVETLQARIASLEARLREVTGG